MRSRWQSGTKRSESGKSWSSLSFVARRNMSVTLPYTAPRDPIRYSKMKNTGYKIKRIELTPGGRLSLQKHRHRSEHWVVVWGTATVVRGSEIITVAKNESTYIPA